MSKYKYYDEHDYVKTEVIGQERFETKERMCRFFSWVMDMEPRDDGFPRWNERPSRLIEAAWVLWRWRIFIHHPTGEPMPFKELATILCQKLHVKMPSNIYSVAYNCRQPGHRSIVDYFAKIYREGKVGLESMLYWREPIKFPKLKSYRGVFK